VLLPASFWWGCVVHCLPTPRMCLSGFMACMPCAYMYIHPLPLPGKPERPGLWLQGGWMSGHFNPASCIAHIPPQCLAVRGIQRIYCPGLSFVSL
jgi:hypothetical protein